MRLVIRRGSEASGATCERQAGSHAAPWHRAPAGRRCRDVGGTAVEAFELAVAAPRTEARGNSAAGRSIHGPGRILAARLRDAAAAD